jgi:hypothetical protein
MHYSALMEDYFAEVKFIAVKHRKEVYSFDRHSLAPTEWTSVPFCFLTISDVVCGNNLDRTKPDATGRPKFADAFSTNFPQLTRQSNATSLAQRPSL